MHEYCISIIIILVVLLILTHCGNKTNFFGIPEELWLMPGESLYAFYGGDEIVVKQQVNGPICINIKTESMGEFKWCSDLVAKSGQFILTIWKPKNKVAEQHTGGISSKLERVIHFDHIATEMLKSKGIPVDESTKNRLIQMMRSAMPQYSVATVFSPM